MATVLILCSLGLMGWSVLGLINPLRFAEGSRARAFGVGVIGFALLMVGGAMLPPTPEPTSTVSGPVPKRSQKRDQLAPFHRSVSLLSAPSFPSLPAGINTDDSDPLGPG